MIFFVSIEIRDTIYENRKFYFPYIQRNKKSFKKSIKNIWSIIKKCLLLHPLLRGK